jgi:hypothetical protein
MKPGEASGCRHDPTKLVQFWACRKATRVIWRMHETPLSCHCEERSDEAIPIQLCAQGVAEIAASLCCSQ